MHRYRSICIAHNDYTDNVDSRISIYSDCISSSSIPLPFIGNPFIDSCYCIPIVIAINSSLSLAEHNTINNEFQLLWHRFAK